MMDLTPTMILIDTPYEDRGPEQTGHDRSPSPRSIRRRSQATPRASDDDLYGLALLQKIFSEAHLRNLSKLVVPIPVIPYPKKPPVTADRSNEMCETPNCGSKSPSQGSSVNGDRRLLKTCLDLGATDVMRSPMNAKCITNLEVHLYKAHRDAAREQQAMMEFRRGRKRSWVGINDEKPYAYLREAMVSSLMNGICRLGEEQDDGIGQIRISVSAQRQAQIAEAVGDWNFSAHEFSDDELVVAASVMFTHALAMPGLEKLRIPAGKWMEFWIKLTVSSRTASSRQSIWLITSSPQTN